MCLQDFLFPEGIAYPIGGAREAMIEMHYDNPDMTEGEQHYSHMHDAASLTCHLALSIEGGKLALYILYSLPFK